MKHQSGINKTSGVKRSMGKLTTVEVEEETAHVSIIDFTTSVSLVLSNYLYCTQHHT